ncbi:hypothetical protein [Bacillus toyonensis]|uniref:hypothetical protein n=1 Tax=Bacillus toyonensis TaxID=155322 RepID=UPI0011A86537|nr:hypothetical protein [Bacillus toyonensis]
MQHIPKYADNKHIKEEIDNYTYILCSQKDLPLKNEIKSIAKYIIFLKEYAENHDKKHYKQYMIFDLLTVMHSLTQTSKRHVYYNLRSFIENVVRTILDFADDDETGVRKLFEAIEKKYEKSANILSIVEFLNGEYGKYCDYVHSNQKAGVTIHLYYTEILSNDDLNEHTLRSIIRNLLTMLQKVTELFLYIEADFIEGIFHRRKQELNYLIGANRFQLFKDTIKST